MNIIIFVHTCKKYEESRAKLIEKTWGDDKDIVFITDNESSQLKNHKYIGSYKPGPTYHPENVIKMFNLFINEYNHYDWFMIIDDDSYLYVEKLKLYLSFFDKTESCLPITRAAWLGHSKTIELLLNFGADINKTTKNKQSAIFYAIQKGRTETVKYLISKNIELDIADHLGYTPLDFAVIWGYYNIALLLLDKVILKEATLEKF